jgi:glutathione S-transferase
LAVARAIELKQIPYRRVEWPPTTHVPMQRLRFGQGTVPGLTIDGEKIVGSRRIMGRLDELVQHLDLIDGWIAEGRLEADQPNAAVLQIGSSIAMLRTMRDLLPLIGGRPAEHLATSQFPGFPGDVPVGTVHREWLPAATAAS